MNKLNPLMNTLCRMGLVLGVSAPVAFPQADESLPPLVGGKVPQTHGELWEGYDPRKEPLEIEVLREWETNGVVLRVLRYRIGVFKGQKAIMAAIYGFPKGAKGLPGLLNIHGGGQYADFRAPLLNAKRGYATLAIAWAGRISAPGYTVDPKGVALFWEGRRSDPNYRLTTDWGALDGYHAPTRYPKNNYGNNMAPAAYTLDELESPRNSPWFLSTMGARRGLTFLEQQPEVDPQKLGAYGHSMGGKLTVATTAADARVKVAAPSCGGVSDRPGDKPLFLNTLGDGAALSRIKCPIFFLSPANDFHGRINDLQTALGEIGTTDVRVTCAPHHNHQDTEPYTVATLLWFDRHLNGGPALPGTPESHLVIKGEKGVPAFTITPDPSRPILGVDIYYTQQGQMDGENDNMENTKARHWHHAPAVPAGKSFRAELPLLDITRPLWVYGNVRYPLEKPVTGTGYYYGEYTATNFILSSPMRLASPKDLADAGVVATAQPTRVIETFHVGWEKEWFRYDTSRWDISTHKVYDPMWKAPDGAILKLTAKGPAGNTLVVTVDGKGSMVTFEGLESWQEFRFIPQDFKDADGESLSNWAGIRELRLQPAVNLKGNKTPIKALGKLWQGADPKFQALEWVDGP